MGTHARIVLHHGVITRLPADAVVDAAALRLARSLVD
jgi:O-acetyl-ADP-ribose deacetylase (regulator of RNase III)